MSQNPNPDQPDKWRFDGDVPATFDEHIARSIPGYHEGHGIVLREAEHFLGKGGLCYELGCSTGALTFALAQAARARNARVVGLDQVRGMLELAERRCRGLDNLRFELADVGEYSFDPACLFVSYYTLQFIPPPLRDKVVRAVYRALTPGGALVLFEKIRFADPQKEQKVTEAYYDFKRSQGFTEREIADKAAALEGILAPFREDENLAMLGQAGFREPRVVFQKMCWQGWVAVK